MKNIHLRVDRAFFNKMRMDKLRRENQLNQVNSRWPEKKLTWEEYVKVLFGLGKHR